MIHAFTAFDSGVFVVQSVHEVIFRELAIIESPHEFEIDALMRRMLLADELLGLWRRQLEVQLFRQSQSRSEMRDEQKTQQGCVAGYEGGRGEDAGGGQGGELEGDRRVREHGGISSCRAQLSEIYGGFPPYVGCVE